MAVPFLDLARVHESLAENVLERWRGILGRNAFIAGEEVSSFEAEFAEHHEVAGCVGVANGTDALVLGLKALGVVAGDRVVVPAFTFIATAEAVRWLGAEPVFVDVDDTLNICPEQLGSLAHDDSIKGIIAVHLYGMPANMDALAEVARRRAWFVLEDAAQAHGAEYKGRRVGGLGDAAAFSFYPTKNLGAMGDAGAVTSPNEGLLNSVREVANHGRRGHHEHARLGINSRMDGLQAAALRVKLPHLDRWTEARRRIAARYTSELAGLSGLRLPRATSGASSVYHQYVVEAEGRDRVRGVLQERGIGTGVYYPKALVDEPAVAGPDPRPGFERARRAASQGLALPIFPGLTDSEQSEVVQAIRLALS